MEKERLEEINKIANNALYFADNSDYATALWQILAEVGLVEFDERGYPIKELVYID